MLGLHSELQDSQNLHSETVSKEKEEQEVEEEEDTSKNCKGNSEAISQVQLEECLFRKHYVQVHYTKYTQQAHTKEKTWLFHHCEVIDIECDCLSHTGVEFPVCLLFSVILKENLGWQKGLVKLENVLEQKFQLYNLESKGKNVFIFSGDHLKVPHKGTKGLEPQPH